MASARYADHLGSAIEALDAAREPGAAALDLYNDKRELLQHGARAVCEILPK